MIYQIIKIIKLTILNINNNLEIISSTIQQILTLYKDAILDIGALENIVNGLLYKAPETKFIQNSLGAYL